MIFREWSLFSMNPHQRQQLFLQQLNEEKKDELKVNNHVSDTIKTKTTTAAITANLSDPSLTDDTLFNDENLVNILDQFLDKQNTVSASTTNSKSINQHIKIENGSISSNIHVSTSNNKNNSLLSNQSLLVDDKNIINDTKSVNNGNVNFDNNSNDEDEDMFGDDLPINDIDDIYSLNQNVNEIDFNMTEMLSSLKEGKEVVEDEEKTKSQSFISKKYQRFIVISIQINTYTMHEKNLLQKELLLVDENQKRNPAKAYLRHDWVHCRINEGDLIHITFTKGSSASDNEYIIDNDNNYLIQYPDRLISCTAVAESFFCLRKSVLQTSSKTLSDLNEPLVLGQIMHQTLQYCLEQKDFKTETIRECLKRIIHRELTSIYIIGEDEASIFQRLVQYIGTIQTFGNLYVSRVIKAGSTIKRDLGPVSNIDCENIAIRDVLNIEEHLWSPAFGIKGMVDATVEILLSPKKKVLIIPFELKTGKANRFISHRAQTILYTLLLSDNYDIDIKAGILYYSRSNSLYMAPAIRSELKSLIIARNELAAALEKQSVSLPPMIQNFHSCQYCTMNDACVVYHKSVEHGTETTSGLGKWFSEHTDHIDSESASFFKHWLRLISLEEKDLDFLRKDVWNVTPEKREIIGKCLRDMVISYNPEEHDHDRDSKYWYTFTRSDEKGKGDKKEEFAPLTDSSITVGDAMIISSMNGHVHLGMGHCVYIDPKSITISLTTTLRHVPQKDVDFDVDINQVFVNWNNKISSSNNQRNIKYRLDKDEAAGGFSLMKSNLVTLMTNPPFMSDTCEKLRKLIINGARPKFTMDQSIVDYIEKKLNHLNPDQQKAVEKVLTCEDYALILGMPGTGKTTTTAEIIKSLVKHNKSVLVTTYTNAALDNILGKLIDQGVDVLRLGNPDKVLPRVRSYMPNGNPELTTVARLKEYYESKSIVGITCYGINDNLFRRKRFDYCIVDEASQITLPISIGPLFYADKFVLVGDQYQLPPIVKENEAMEAGFSNSLFSILAKSHPESIVYLEYQYRMNRDIMAITNKLIYDYKLKCGSDIIANKSLKIPHFNQGIASIHSTTTNCDSLDGLNSYLNHDDCWLKHIIDPSNKVVFVDTDNLPARESRLNVKHIENREEAALLYQATEALLACGLKEEQLAIISVYRTQIRLISQHFAGERPDLEISTIDKYQGRDKDCILISFVRSNHRGVTGDLLRDWKRLNVAFTRAKCKLIVFGSSSTLKHSVIFGTLLTLLEANKWIYKLKSDARKLHELQIPFKTRDLNTAHHRQRKHQTKTSSSTNIRNIEDRPILKDIYNYTLQE
ncbi:unnamed protein product [Cunninghamella blakesleeana]